MGKSLERFGAEVLLQEPLSLAEICDPISSLNPHL